MERFLGAITTGCMRPFVPWTNKNERTTTLVHLDIHVLGTSWHPRLGTHSSSQLLFFFTMQFIKLFTMQLNLIISVLWCWSRRRRGGIMVVSGPLKVSPTITNSTKEQNRFWHSLKSANREDSRGQPGCWHLLILILLVNCKSIRTQITLTLGLALTMSGSLAPSWGLGLSGVRMLLQLSSLVCFPLLFTSLNQPLITPSLISPPHRHFRFDTRVAPTKSEVSDRRSSTKGPYGCDGRWQHESEETKVQLDSGAGGLKPGSFLAILAGGFYKI